MADGGLLLLGALALAASQKKSVPKPPDPPKEPDAGPGPGGLDPGVQKGLELGGAALGTVLTTFLGAGGGTGAGVGGGGTALIGTGAGVGGSAPVVGGSTAILGAASLTTVTVGGVFCLAWAALYVLQFIIIDALDQQRDAWLRYRHKVYGMKRPFLWLQSFERVLVDETLEKFGLPSSPQLVGAKLAATATHPASWTELYPGGGVWNDPRLTIESATGSELRQMPNWRVQYDNPFRNAGALILPDGERVDFTNNPWLQNAAWRHLQMGARLVASRYVFELAKFAGRMLSGMPGLGGVATSGAMLNPPHEVWAYPLLGGGQPDKDYPGYKAEVLDAEAKAAAKGKPFATGIEDVLNAAKLAAFLHASAAIAMDPEIRPTFSAAQYGTAFYMAMCNGDPSLHMGHYGAPWEHTIRIDPVFYKVPVNNMWLDVHMLKGGFPCAPFLADGTPTPRTQTALAVTL